MNDKKIDDLLNDYSQCLGHSRHAGSVREGRVSLWKPVLVTAIGAAAVGAFVLMPRRAEAAPYERVMRALKNTKSWTATCRTREQGGAWTLQYRSFHHEGKLRGESPVFGGAPRTYVTIIDSDIEYNDHSDLPYILKSKFVLDTRMRPSTITDPLKNSLQLVGGEMRKDFVRTDGVIYKGADAYSLSLYSKKTGKKYFELLVQKASNLPLAVLVNNINPTTKKSFEYRIDYSYVPPTDLSLFKPDPKKYIVDEDADKARFQAEWGKIPSTPETPTIYSSSISPDGTIWITFGVKDRMTDGWTSLKILDKNYTRCTSYLMNSYGNSKDFRVSGNEVVTANYVAIDPKKPLPTNVQVEFGFMHAFLSEPKGMKRKTVKCNLSKESRQFPAHFPCFMQDVRIGLIRNSELGSRAHALMNFRDYLGAGKAFEEQHQLLRTAGFYNAGDPLKAAISCYERLGMKQKVRELKELGKSDPKRPKF